jgi:Lantibiotic dehydratase, N terminus
LLVVGDCHATRELLSHSGASPFMHAAFPDLGRAVIAQYQNIIESDETLVDLIRDHPDKGAVQIPLPCFDLEVLGRSAKHRRDVISLDTLRVRDVGASLRLYSPRLGTHVRLIAPPAGGASARTDPLVIFSFPRFFARPPILGKGRPYLPRVIMGRVVVQRRTWQIPASDWLAAEGTDAAAFLHLRRLRRRLGLPQRLFAKVDGEAKPLFVDSEAPLLVRQFDRQVRRCSGLVTLSEMLPGPDGLWLDGQQGRVCSEFRLAMFDDGTPRQRMSAS